MESLSGDIGNCKVESPQPQVTRTCIQLAGRLDSLDKTINSLEERLSMILRQEPSCGSDCCEKEHQVELAQALSTQADRIMYCDERLSSILTRLEL